MLNAVSELWLIVTSEEMLYLESCPRGKVLIQIKTTIIPIFRNNDYLFITLYAIKLLKILAIFLFECPRYATQRANLAVKAIDIFAKK